LPRGERGVANGREKTAAGAQAKRGASGDRRFFSEYARAQPLEKQINHINILGFALWGVAGCPRWNGVCRKQGRVYGLG